MDNTKSATWTDHHFSLANTERPVVTTHDEAVSFSSPGFMRDGTGFALRFTRQHLGVVRELLAAMEALPWTHDDEHAWAERESVEAREQEVNQYWADLPSLTELTLEE